MHCARRWSRLQQFCYYERQTTNIQHWQPCRTSTSSKFDSVYLQRKNLEIILLMPFMEVHASQHATRPSSVTQRMVTFSPILASPCTCEITPVTLSCVSYQQGITTKICCNTLIQISFFDGTWVSFVVADRQPDIQVSLRGPQFNGKFVNLVNN
jgi:hypothetical protein